MTTTPAPRVWLYCVTHDVRFLTRSPASMEHRRADCVVVPDEEPAT